MAHRLAVARETRRAVREVAEPLLVADRRAAVGAAAETVDALPAFGREERDDVVAGLHERHTRSDALDDTRTLVSEHAGCVPGRIRSGRRVQIRVAHTARREPDEHLALLRLGEVELLDDERSAELLEHGGADPHTTPLDGIGEPRLSVRAARMRQEPERRSSFPSPEYRPA